MDKPFRGPAAPRAPPKRYRARMAETLPLNALLGQAIAALTDPDLSPSLPVWANVLRPVGDGIALKDLPAAARLSKRAIRAAVGAAEKNGWLVTENRTVRLTAKAEAVEPPADVWPELQPPLRAVVHQLYLEWPHYPAGYGPADDSTTGSVYTAGGGLIDSKVPTHADDWSPVAREDVDGSSVVGLPTYALLSQALMAFAADFEELWIGGLHHAATVLRLIPDDGAPIKDFPLLANLPGNGKSVLERHLYIEIGGKPKTAYLTSRGRNTRDNYAATVGRVEERWSPKYGADNVAALRAALESLHLDPSLPHHVVGSLV